MIPQESDSEIEIRTGELSGKAPEGNKRRNIEKRKKLKHEAVATEASADSTER